MIYLVTYFVLGVIFALVHGLIVRSRIERGDLMPARDWIEIVVALGLCVLLWPIVLFCEWTGRKS